MKDEGNILLTLFGTSKAAQRKTAMKFEHDLEDVHDEQSELNRSLQERSLMFTLLPSAFFLPPSSFILHH
jgi:hypothetical protein